MITRRGLVACTLSLLCC